MSDERVPRLFTPEEYLLIEREAPFRSEYDHRRIYAMAGASHPHLLIVDNIIGFLFSQLRATTCRAMTHSVKVRSSAVPSYPYPDVVLTCGEAVLEDKDSGILLNPVSIFEVSSPSTKRYDHVAKYTHYREIESLRDDVLVSQTSANVVHHFKEEDGFWNTRVLTNSAETLTLTGAPASLSLNEIYERIELAPRE